MSSAPRRRRCRAATAWCPPPIAGRLWRGSCRHCRCRCLEPGIQTGRATTADAVGRSRAACRPSRHIWRQSDDRSRPGARPTAARCRRPVRWRSSHIRAVPATRRSPANPDAPRDTCAQGAEPSRSRRARIRNCRAPSPRSREQSTVRRTNGPHRPSTLRAGFPACAYCRRAPAPRHFAILLLPRDRCHGHTDEREEIATTHGSDKRHSRRTHPMGCIIKAARPA